MKLVVDANVLFSLLIKESKTAELFLNFSLELYTPEFVLEEFENHKEEILGKTQRSEEEFNYIFESIKQIVKVVHIQDFKYYRDYFEEAKKISPDENDIDYFVLALKLDCGIWSNDKKLKEQNFVEVYSTEEIIRRLETK